jgi:hypothetical protein
MTAIGRRICNVAFVTIALALIAASSNNTIISAIASIPLVLVLPGLAILTAADPDQSILSGVERYFWSGVLSIGFAVLGGLILNVTTSLDRPSWIVLLAGITGAALVVAFVRARLRLPSSEEVGDTATTRQYGLRQRGVLVAVGIAVLAFIVVGNFHQSRSVSANAHKVVAAVPTTTSTTNAAIVASQCEPIDATSTIGFVVNRDSAGTYYVVALGSATNQSSDPMKSVVVTWNVTYADRSTGAPTSTQVRGSLLAPGRSAPWGELATTNDGQVPPTGVEVTQISGTNEGTGTPISTTQCQTAIATSTIGTAVSRDASGNFNIVALGVVTNRSSAALCDVVVSWTASYADGTTGTLNETLVRGAVIPRGGSATWGEQSTTTDGQVRPTQVEVTRISGVPEGPACAT